MGVTQIKNKNRDRIYEGVTGRSDKGVECLASKSKEGISGEAASTGREWNKYRRVNYFGSNLNFKIPPLFFFLPV